MPATRPTWRTPPPSEARPVSLSLSLSLLKAIRAFRGTPERPPRARISFVASSLSDSKGCCAACVSRCCCRRRPSRRPRVALSRASRRRCGRRGWRARGRWPAPIPPTTATQPFQAPDLGDRSFQRLLSVAFQNTQRSSKARPPSQTKLKNPTEFCKSKAFFVGRWPGTRVASTVQSCASRSVWGRSSNGGASRSS